MKDYINGPWSSRSSCVINKNDEVVCALVIGSVTRDSEDEDYATAQLISAAPDLLEALELVINRFGPCEKDYIFSKRMALQKAITAIAKAKGEN